MSRGLEALPGRSKNQVRNLNRSQELGILHDKPDVRVWSLVSDLRLNSTLSQSWQRELVRALVNFTYTTYTCLTICPYLLIRCYYIIKRKEKEKKYKYWLRGVWQFMTLLCSFIFLFLSHLESHSWILPLICFKWWHLSTSVHFVVVHEFSRAQLFWPLFLSVINKHSEILF